MKIKDKIPFLILLAFLGYIFYLNYFAGNTSSLPVTVTINDMGFSPDKIVVEPGTTITWVSGGERLHWPASNFHPTHTLYPKPGGCLGSLLDACRGLQNGESFSFKFDKFGIWSMHDHLFPGFSMTVEVSEEKDSKNIFVYNEKTAVADFRKFNYNQQLDFIKMMSEDSPGGAWSYAKEAFILGNQVVGNAHEFAHIIGNKSFEKLGLDGVQICDAAFAFGCFHGVTEKMLLTEGLGSIKSIEEGCLRIFPPGKSENYTGCIHGTGHGVYSFEGGNLKKALTDCDIISKPYREYCYDGVFMENSSTPEKRIFDAKNPWKFCAELPERYHRGCGRYQSQIFLGRSGTPNSANLVGQNCALGPSALLWETCFESLGYYIAQGSLGKVENILRSCRQMPSTEGVELCITGAAKESVFQKYVGFADSARGLCRSLTEPRQSTCLSNIGRMINSSAH